MKKVIYLILAGSLWLPIQATPTQSDRSVATLDQLRIGIGLAIEYMNVEAHLREDFTPFGKVAKGDRFHATKKMQIAPAVEMGVPLLKDYYLGILMSWRYSGVKTTSRAPLKNNTYFLHDFRVLHYLDVLIKGGYMLNSQTMIYGLIGPTIAKWSHTTDQFQLDTKQDRFKISETSPGLAFGVGMEYMFRKDYALSIDFSHHILRATAKQQSMTFIDFRGGPIRLSGNITKKVTPSFSTIALRLTTYFSL